MKRRNLVAIATAMTLLPAFFVVADESQMRQVDQAIESGKPILVHVTAPWCETCQAQKPIVKDLLSRPDLSGLTKIDVDFDSQKDVLAKLRVTTQSTMIVFKDGKEVDRQVGQTDPAAIEALLKEAL
jgi:thioredoxin 1